LSETCHAGKIKKKEAEKFERSHNMEVKRLGEQVAQALIG